MRIPNQHVRIIKRLCQLAGDLGVPVLTALPWPDDFPEIRHSSGVFIPSRWSGSRALLKHFGVNPPAIVLRSYAPDVLAHELGHVIFIYAGLERGKRGDIVPPLLRRAAARHGFDMGCCFVPSELRAESLGRRLLGQRLSPTLLRVTAPAWAALKKWRVWAQ